MPKSGRALPSAAAPAVIALTGVASLAMPVSAAAPNSAWHIVASPNLNTTAVWDNRLLGVTCAPAGDCWAVGQYFDGTFYRTLIEHEAGGQWSLVSSPNATGSQDSVLQSVSCLPDGTCWAVGNWQESSGVIHTLTEHEVAGIWQVVPSPDATEAVPTRTPDSYLYGVSCVAVDNCWAAGSYLVPGQVEPVFVPGQAPQTLVEHYDGSAWSIVSSPNNNSNENALYGLDCPSASLCWAVGLYLNASATSSTTTYETLVERYDGTSWTIVPTPNAGSAESALFAVACPATTCVSSGLASDTGGPNQTLAESYDGSGWTVAPSADETTDTSNSLGGVACTSVTACWAVGTYDSTGQFDFQTLVEQRTDAGWSIVPSQNVAGETNALAAVACDTAGTCWAVGFQQPAGGQKQTLVETDSVAPAPSVPDLPLVPLSMVAAAGATGLCCARARGRRHESSARRTTQGR